MVDRFFERGGSDWDLNFERQLSMKEEGFLEVGKHIRKTGSAAGD
jgi:hypothetical protein